MRISDWSSDVCSSDLPPSPSGEEQRDLRACSLVAAGWAIRIYFITAPAISAPAAPAAPASPPPAPRTPPLRRPPRASAPRAARQGNARTAPPASPAAARPRPQVGREPCRARGGTYG